MRRAAPLVVLPLIVAACAPISPERAAERCEERARAAQGPQGNVTLGVNSNSGPFITGEIGISGDFVAGRDPQSIYRYCVLNLTGAAPIRPPNLRPDR